MERRARWLAAHPFCVDCLAETPRRLTCTDVEVDHITPLFKGGRDDDSNLQTLCRRHHEIKSARERGHRVPQLIGPDGWPVEE